MSAAGIIFPFELATLEGSFDFCHLSADVTYLKKLLDDALHLVHYLI